MAGRAGGRVGAEVTLGCLAPPAFHRCLREHDVLVDAPLARRPAEDLGCRAGEVAADAVGEQPVRPRVVARGEEVAADMLAGDLVEPPVHALVLGQRPGPDPRRALRA